MPMLSCSKHSIRNVLCTVYSTVQYIVLYTVQLKSYLYGRRVTALCTPAKAFLQAAWAGGGKRRLSTFCILLGKKGLLLGTLPIVVERTSSTCSTLFRTHVISTHKLSTVHVLHPICVLLCNGCWLHSYQKAYSSISHYESVRYTQPFDSSFQ